MDLPQLPPNKDLTYIGYSTFRDKNTLFGIKRRDRRQHIYILGKSGTGKSVLMSNMIMQNILNGEGVCVVDPHGELVEGVLQAIPEHRLKDVVYFNPADTEYHIGFNVLELVDSKYKHLVASGLMGIFTKIWANAWSARMEYILNNCILALLDTPGTTLLGIPRMLVDKDYRQKIINNLKDPVIKAFWIHEYEAWQDKFRNEAIAPIQNKVGQFLSTSVIRNIVGQSKSTINIFDMMNEGKIFLVNVSKGRIGEDNSKLLGGMIITKIQLAAMERVRIPEEERKDFYLYVDEFQNFVTDSFASILSEARKYRLNLTVAHQYTAQLVTKESSAMRDSIFGNVGTMIVFRVGADDADFLEKEFAPEFTPEDIVNLPNYKIYLKLMIDGITSRPFSSKTIAPLVKGGNLDIERRVVESSRELYCRTKEDIEKEINDWSGMALGDIGNARENNKAINPNGEKFETVCSNCGTMTTVPFKPEPGRAVYCKDCIVKIKAGEIKPIRVSPDQLKKDETRFFKPLADLGIEFAGGDSNSNVKKENRSEPVVNNNFNSQNKSDFPKNNFTPVKKNFVNNIVEKVIPKNPIHIRPEKPKISGLNLGLKEILDIALHNKDIEEVKEKIPEPRLNIPDKNNDDINKGISLSDLKVAKIENPTNSKDRSASSDLMNSFRNMISEKVDDIIVTPARNATGGDKIEPARNAEVVASAGGNKINPPVNTQIKTESQVKPEIKTEPIKSEIKEEIKIETRQEIREEKKEEIKLARNPMHNVAGGQEIKSEPVKEKTGTPPPLTEGNIQEIPEEVLRRLLEDRE
ncbi:MAG: CxxC-x17-CxxC domain-containing protein [Candidatus Paceibacterota bacterium]